MISNFLSLPAAAKLTLQKESKSSAELSSTCHHCFKQNFWKPPPALQGEALDWMIASNTLSCFPPTSQVHTCVLSALYYFGMKHHTHGPHVTVWLNGLTSKCNWGETKCSCWLEFSSLHSLTYMIPPEVGLLTQLRSIQSSMMDAGISGSPWSSFRVGNILELTWFWLEIWVEASQPNGQL